jgi:hypothetical protein
VVLEAVVRLDHAGGAALRRAGVAAHRIDLGDERDLEGRVRLRERDGGAQSCAPCADDRYVRADCFYFGPMLPYLSTRRLT